MIRTAYALGLAVVLGTTVQASEMDEEFGPKSVETGPSTVASRSILTVGGTEMDAEAPVGAWHHGFGRGFGFGGFGFGRGFGFGGFGFGRGFGFGGYGLGLGYGGWGFGGLGYGGWGYGGLGYGGLGYGGLGGFYGGYSSIGYYSPFIGYGYGYGCW